MATAAERLGYPTDARLLIVTGDDLGMCHAANVATVAGLRRGLLTSASLMVPCSWAIEAVQLAVDRDVGIHLTLTAEWSTYRWGPLTAAARELTSGLVDPQGYFWPRLEPVHTYGNTRAARIEAEAQIEWALSQGLEPTKLDDHMGVFATHPELLAIYVDLARYHRLPLRLETERQYREGGRPDLAEIVRAARQELLVPDQLAHLPLRDPERLERQLIEMISGLPTGVTELIVHVAAPGEELTAITPDAPARVEAARLVTASEAVAQAIAAAGICLIGYRDLREALRAGA